MHLKISRLSFVCHYTQSCFPLRLLMDELRTFWKPEKLHAKNQQKVFELIKVFCLKRGDFIHSFIHLHEKVKFLCCVQVRNPHPLTVEESFYSQFLNRAITPRRLENLFWRLIGYKGILIALVNELAALPDCVWRLNMDKICSFISTTC